MYILSDKINSVTCASSWNYILEKPINLWCKWHKSLFFSEINTKQTNTVSAECTILDC